MNRFVYIVVILSFLCIGHGADAQDSDTPVADIVRIYKGERGTRELVASGTRLNMVRVFIKRTPVGPVADDVTELSVLKMQNAEDSVKEAFVRDLRDALKPYQYVGIEESPNGPVEVYVLLESSDEVVELIVYNAEIFSLNCLYGPFSADSLRKLSTK